MCFLCDSRTNCIAIGAKTLQTTTFEAKLVMKIVKVIIRKIMNEFGSVFKFCKTSPIRPFRSEYSSFAASERANPPPAM